VRKQLLPHAKTNETPASFETEKLHENRVHKQETQGGGEIARQYGVLGYEHSFLSCGCILT